MSQPVRISAALAAYIAHGLGPKIRAAFPPGVNSCAKCGASLAGCRWGIFRRGYLGLGR